jgi:hypothetical protein
MKYLSRDIRSRALHEVALPIPFDAAAMPGARVLGDDGREYVSIRWPEVSDTYQWVSAAQIAEDVAADVARAAECEHRNRIQVRLRVGCRAAKG